MRSVMGERRAVSRTGVRAVAANKQAKKPQRARKASSARSFARQSSFSDSFISRWVENVQERVSIVRPFTALTVGLIVAVVLYGLVIGGHVALAANEVAAQGNRFLGIAGFRIDDVTVTGRNHADKTALLAALGISRDDPIFGFDTEAARQRLEEVDWVKSATVTRLLPDAIRVDLVERAPYAIWQRGGSMSIVDREGHTITEDNLESFPKVPFVVGFGGAKALEDIYTLMQQTQPELLSRVRAFVRVGDRRWNLRLENGVDLKLPEVGIEQALADAAALDKDNKIFSRDIAAVDLRLPDRVTVTLTAEAIAARDSAMTPVKGEAKTAAQERAAAQAIAQGDTNKSNTNKGDTKILNAVPAAVAVPVGFTTGGGNT